MNNHDFSGIVTYDMQPTPTLPAKDVEIMDIQYNPEI